jgi:hypothetical protein
MGTILVRLTRYQIKRLVDLVGAEVQGVERGEIVGYGQSRQDELTDLTQISDALREAQ